MKHVAAKHQRDMSVYSTYVDKGIMIQEVHLRQETIIDRWILVDRGGNGGFDGLTITDMWTGKSFLPRWLLIA